METRARFVLVGLFTLAVILAGFGFVYWLNNAGGLGERTTYRIQFDNSVAGLLLGSDVRFNGIRVGEVTGMKLNPDDPRQVMVTIAVASDTPVRTDTEVSLIFGGLTGVPEIALTGGTPDAPPPQATGGQPPLLVASADATIDWTTAARDAFTKVNTLLSDNSKNLTDTIANLKTFSAALSRNSDKLDSIVAGLAKLAGANISGKNAAFFDLPAATGFPPIAKEPSGQLIVGLPIVPNIFNSQNILVHSGEGDKPAFEGSGWADAMPKLVQTAIVRSFENAGYSRVGRDFQGLTADDTLTIDMDIFQVLPDAKQVKVGYTASIVDASGTIAASKRFDASAPLPEMQAEAAANALGAALQQTEKPLVTWALGVLETSAATSP